RLPDLGDRGGRHAAFGALFGAPCPVRARVAAVPLVAGIDLDGSGRRRCRRGRRRRWTRHRSSASTARASGSVTNTLLAAHSEKRRARRKEAPLSAFRLQRTTSHVK